MATVNKNFRIKHGLVVEGTTGTINGNNILTETASDTYILNLIGGETLVKSVSGDLSVDSAGDLSIDTEGLFDTLVTDGLATSSSVTTALGDYTTTATLDTTVGGYGYLKTGDLPTMYSDSDVDAHLSGGNAIDYTSGTIDLRLGSGLEINGANQVIIDRTDVDTWYDSSGAASTAQSNAEDYTDTALESYTPTSSLDTTVGGYGYLKSADLSAYATETYADNAADTAEGNANVYTNNLIGDVSVDGTAGNTVTDRIESAVASLVNGAPELLDTLNELAAAIGDDENYATTVSGLIADKQNNLTAGNGIDITSDTVSVAFDAGSGLAINGTNLTIDSAVIATKSYVDGLASDYDASGTAAGLVNDLTDAVTAFSAINVASVAKQVAANGTVGPAGTYPIINWKAEDYRSAKLLVKTATGTHTEVSEILLTLDSSDNIAITEYAIVGTNGSISTISANIQSVSGQSYVRVTIAVTDDEVSYSVYGTLLV